MNNEIFVDRLISHSRKSGKAVSSLHHQQRVARWKVRSVAKIEKGQQMRARTFAGDINEIAGHRPKVDV